MREIDARVAVEVMGISLIPPRGRALARVGSALTSETGTPWKLHNGKTIIVPPGNSLPQPEGTTKLNDRYMAYVAEHSGEDVDALVAALRDEPDPYSSQMAVAWLVVEKMEADGFWLTLTRRTSRGDEGTEEGPWWVATFRCVRGGTRGDHTARARTVAEAICLATLRAVAK